MYRTFYIFCDLTIAHVYDEAMLRNDINRGELVRSPLGVVSVLGLNDGIGLVCKHGLSAKKN